MLKIISFLTSIMIFFTNLFGLNMKIAVFDHKNQTINGFGTSACWWAQMVDTEETRTQLAEALFSEDGLGLNIYRYNVGGGVNPEKNRIGDRSRQTESFYYFNEESGRFEFDFTRDANAQKMLEKALSYGCIDTVVLFANSPHYSMTINGETAGSESGGVSNLDPEMYQDFVDYFLTITEYFVEKGVPVKYISPINEPQWDWGGDWVGQEGCHYSPEQVAELMELFAKGIKERKLPVKLMAPESGQIGETNKALFNAVGQNPLTASEIGSFAYHSYWEDGNFKDKIEFGDWMRDSYPDVMLDMTEWCELPCCHDVNDVKAAVIMARVMASDFRLDRCNSWSNWVAVNSTDFNADGNAYSDGLFYATDGSYENVKKTARYYAFAHFSKFIPVGSVMLEATASRSEKNDENSEVWQYLTNFVAFRTPERKTVIVIVNEDEAKDIRLSVKPGLKMQVWTTDEGRRLEKTYDGFFKTKIGVAKDSITTVVIG